LPDIRFAIATLPALTVRQRAFTRGLPHLVPLGCSTFLPYRRASQFALPPLRPGYRAHCLCYTRFGPVPHGCGSPGLPHYLYPLRIPLPLQVLVDSRQFIQRHTWFPVWTPNTLRRCATVCGHYHTFTYSCHCRLHAPLLVCLHYFTVLTPPLGSRTRDAGTVHAAVLSVAVRLPFPVKTPSAVCKRGCAAAVLRAFWFWRLVHATGCSSLPSGLDTRARFFARARFPAGPAFSRARVTVLHTLVCGHFAYPHSSHCRWRFGLHTLPLRFATLQHRITSSPRTFWFTCSGSPLVRFGFCYIYGHLPALRFTGLDTRFYATVHAAPHRCWTARFATGFLWFTLYLGFFRHTLQPPPRSTRVCLLVGLRCARFWLCPALCAPVGSFAVAHTTDYPHYGLRTLHCGFLPHLRLARFAASTTLPYLPAAPFPITLPYKHSAQRLVLQCRGSFSAGDITAFASYAPTRRLPVRCCGLHLPSPPLLPAARHSPLHADTAHAGNYITNTCHTYGFFWFGPLTPL